MGKSYRLLLLLFLFPFLCFQFFYGLGQLGLVGPDEPRYAQVAKEMMDSRDYITPHLFGEPWFEKPVLYYWLAAFSYKLIGVTEIAARLPSALSGILLLFAVYIIGWKWQSWRCGLYASLMLASSPMCIALSRAATMDMLLAAALTWSLGGFYLGYCSAANVGNTQRFDPSKLNRTFLLASYVFLGVAALAKGPVSVVLFTLILVVFFMVEPKRFSLQRLKLVQGGGLFIGITFPWYVLCYCRNGWVFINEFLLQHNVARYMTNQFQHTQPIWFFLPVIAIGFLPWTFQFAAAGSQFLKQFRKAGWSARDPDVIFLWLWVAVPLVFFSFSRSKLPGYILPAFPAMALLTASYWQKRFDKPSHLKFQKRIFRIEFFQAVLLISAGLGIALWGKRFASGIGSAVSIIGWPMAGIGGVGLVLSYLGRYRTLFGCYVAGAAMIIVLIVCRVFPQVDPTVSTRQLAQMLKQKGYRGETVYVYGVSRNIAYGLSFYMNSNTHIIYSLEDIGIRKGSVFYLVTPSSEASNAFPKQLGVESEFLFNEQKVWKIFAQDKPTS